MCLERKVKKAIIIPNFLKCSFKVHKSVLIKYVVTKKVKFFGIKKGLENQTFLNIKNKYYLFKVLILERATSAALIITGLVGALVSKG